VPRDRPADGNHARQHTIRSDPDSELHAPRRPMMPVIRLDEIARLRNVTGTITNLTPPPS
jgi:hypothetical protein